MNESTKTASVVALQCVLNYLFNFLYFFSLLQNNFLFEKPPPTSVLNISNFFDDSENWVQGIA